MDIRTTSRQDKVKAPIARDGQCFFRRRTKKGGAVVVGAYCRIERREIFKLHQSDANEHELWTCLEESEENATLAKSEAGTCRPSLRFAQLREPFRLYH